MSIKVIPFQKSDQNEKTTVDLITDESYPFGKLEKIGVKNDMDPEIFLEKKSRNTKEKIALNDIQEKEILEISYKSNYSHGLIIEFALNTSVRVNELGNLIISNLNLDPKDAYVKISDRPAGKYAGSFKCKTPFSNRMNPLSKEIAEKLRGFIKNRKTGYVFESQIGSDGFKCYTKNSLIKIINKYAKLCPSIGRNIGFHATRRTYASKLLAQNTPINQISLALGHSDISTTIKYLRQIRTIDLNMIRTAITNENCARNQRIK